MAKSNIAQIPTQIKPRRGDLLEDMVEAWGLPPFRQVSASQERITESNEREWQEWYGLVKQGEQVPTFSQWLQNERAQASGPPVDIIDKHARETLQEFPYLMRRVSHIEEVLNIRRKPAKKWKGIAL